MSEWTKAVEVVAQVIDDEGGRPGSSLHSWRCEYPDRYGECSCVAETAEEVVKALRTAGLLAVSELPIPADDDAPCPRCGCPTACPEGRTEALSAELAEAKAERDALAAQLDALRAECEDQRGARKVAADAADRFRDVLAECLGHDDNNPGDDALVAEVRARFGKTGPEPTRWRDFLTGALARVDQINAMPDPRALLGGDEREGGRS